MLDFKKAAWGVDITHTKYELFIQMDSGPLVESAGTCASDSRQSIYISAES